jgi:hypothetical protein
MAPEPADYEESTSRRRETRPILREGRVSKAKSRYVRKRLSAHSMVSFHSLSGVGYSSPHALGDAVRAAMVKRIEFQLEQGVAVRHVKDGKPLTAHGAELLGMPWEGEIQ